ncbi:uncharacterized protein PITG_00012 [Phytophthora infestans T30-4]|uniref:Uncharacterized protein n=1 Tax=Phytophthora infestans (strain T30-4) TaxID=403677 RepID=D0MSM9_PHYIT|nr:uncharacterized protein PITG_00012 [Phytophthora infestans T30-4]EEY57463.1 conserved hypothetical protein [Phytophthora infestans T30-4]|eukprot:XP_002908649.1 conserved hypothetical protein [Phytophthora infestans T30-4]
MGLSEFFHSVWDFVCRPFEDCTSCCDVLDPDYYRKTSPGVHRSPQMFNRWEHGVKYNITSSRPPSSGSRSDSPSNYSYEEEEEERQVQFLFYGGSDPPTPTSVGDLYPSGGYRSDMISNYVEPMSPAASIESPRISHEMPCFFSPRNTPLQSPMSAPIYSPHLFKISEQRMSRRSTGYYNMRYSR